MVNKPRFARITAAALVLTLLLPTAALADDSTSRDFDVKVESGYYLYSLSLIELSGTLDETGAVENLEIDVTPMDYAGAAAYPASAAVNAVLDDIHDAQQDKLAEKVGETPETLDGVWEHLRID